MWHFDRFARSVKHLITALEQFRNLKINFISLQEQCDTSIPIGRAIFTIIGAKAQLERDIIRERVKAGLDRMRAQGIRLGRPSPRPIPIRSRCLSSKAYPLKKSPISCIAADPRRAAAGWRREVKSSFLAPRLLSQDGLLATEITTAKINDYILKRKSEKTANGTINRELRGLGRMFRLAAQQTPPLVFYTPNIPHLREDNIRKGFFTEAEYRKLLAALPDHLKVPLCLGYWTGMRAGEILNLKWDRINLQEGWIRLEPGTTKNGHGRTVPLVAQARDYVAAWKEDTLSAYPRCMYVCHYRSKQLRKIPQRMWRDTCEKVGMKGKLFHDLRRTAVRNMVRAGISERVAMEISGHQTWAVFDRYDIVNEIDLSNAVARLQKRTDFISGN